MKHLSKYFYKVLALTLWLILPMLAEAQYATPATITNPAPGYFVQLSGGNTFLNLFSFFIQALLGLSGILAMFFIIIGGFQYVTARGDEEMAKNAKKTLLNAIIGLTIIILSFIIVTVIYNELAKA